MRYTWCRCKRRKYSSETFQNITVMLSSSPFYSPTQEKDKIDGHLLKNAEKNGTEVTPFFSA